MNQTSTVIYTTKSFKFCFSVLGIMASQSKTLLGNLLTFIKYTIYIRFLVETADKGDSGQIKGEPIIILSF